MTETERLAVLVKSFDGYKNQEFNRVKRSRTSCDPEKSRIKKVYCRKSQKLDMKHISK